MPKEEATPEEPVGPNHNYPLEQAPGLEEKPGKPAVGRLLRER